MKINGIFHFLQFNQERNKLNLNLSENSARCVSNPTGAASTCNDGTYEIIKLLFIFSYRVNHFQLLNNRFRKLNHHH